MSSPKQYLVSVLIIDYSEVKCADQDQSWGNKTCCAGNHYSSYYHTVKKWYHPIYLNNLEKKIEDIAIIQS